MDSLISVIVPFQKETEELQTCLTAIEAQTFTNFEVLLVPDGASKEAMQVAQGFVGNRYTLLDNGEAQGQSEARQRAIGVAKGEYIAIQDADDISLSHRLEKQVAEFKADQNLDVLGSAAKIIGEKYNWEVYQKHDQIVQQALFNNPMIHSSVIMRREVFEKLSYNSTFDTTEDYDLFSLALRHFRFKNLSEPLISYKLPAQNKSSLLDQRMKARIIRERNNQWVPEHLMHAFHHFCELNNSIMFDELSGLKKVFKGTEVESVFNDQLLRYALKHKPRWSVFQKQKIWQKSILMRKASVLKSLLLS